MISWPMYEIKLPLISICIQMRQNDPLVLQNPALSFSNLEPQFKKPLQI